MIEPHRDPRDPFTVSSTRARTRKQHVGGSLATLPTVFVQVRSGLEPNPPRCVKCHNGLDQASILCATTVCTTCELADLGGN